MEGTQERWNSWQPTRTRRVDPEQIAGGERVLSDRISKGSSGARPRLYSVLHAMMQKGQTRIDTEGAGVSPFLSGGDVGDSGWSKTNYPFCMVSGHPNPRGRAMRPLMAGLRRKEYSEQ